MTVGNDCCVYGCGNTQSNTRTVKPMVTFYLLPGQPWEKKRRSTWINFIKRQHLDGSLWQPTKYSRICSWHFVSNEKSQDPRKPNYNPTIHPYSSGATRRNTRNVLLHTKDGPSRALHTKPLNLTVVLQPYVPVTKLPNSSVTLLSTSNIYSSNVFEYPKKRKGWTSLFTTSHSPISNINTLIPQHIPSIILPEMVELRGKQAQDVNLDTTCAKELNYYSNSNYLYVSTPGKLSTNRKQTLQPRNVNYEDEFECFEADDDEMKIEIDYPSF